MRTIARCALAAYAVLSAVDTTAQSVAPTVHAIYLTAVEFKGSTTTGKLMPPDASPALWSRGYVYRKPGEADPSAPDRWEVASYQFSPAFVTVQQGDSVMLRVFIANGDHHEVRLTDPDGQTIMNPSRWDRGREYAVFVQTQKAGSYRLECKSHAPSMTATIMVLPR
jgi:plastocyanin